MEVFGSPTLEGLAAGPRGIGPVVVASSALDGVCAADWRSPWAVAAALAERGEEGAVVPDCINDAEHDGRRDAWPEVRGERAVELCLALGPAMTAALAMHGDRATGSPPAAGGPWERRAAEAERELARIMGSRGWRWLSRVYAALHILKGRGGGKA
jgi:hypothetical protein